MSEERFVWFRPLERLGEEAVDLYTCRRFMISRYDPGSFVDLTLIYYQTSDDRWIECRGDEEIDNAWDGLRIIYMKYYAECNPITVAHKILNNKIYKGKLPEELESYRMYGDSAVYLEWANRTLPGFGAGENGRTRPTWDGRTIFLGTKVCIQFKKSAPSQFKLLDAFTAKRWTHRVDNPFSGAGQLKDTVDSMNEWPDSPIAFRQDGRQASWFPKPPRPNSANSS